MSRNYDNWEKLVGAVLRREKDRQLALYESFSTSTASLDFSSRSTIGDNDDVLAVRKMLARPIQLTEQVIRAADEAVTFKQECLELKSKTEKLAELLRQAACANSDLYEQPMWRVLDEAVQQVLDKSLALVLKCNGKGLVRRVLTIIPAASFRKTSLQLENSAGDVSWLLHVSASTADE